MRWFLFLDVDHVVNEKVLRICAMKKFLYGVLFLIAAFCYNAFAESNFSSDTVKIIFGGDVMLARNVDNCMRTKGYDFPFLQIKHYFQSSDIAIINLESVISNIGKPLDKKYVFRANLKCLEGLMESGIDVVSLANNHCLDYLGNALLHCIELLDSFEIASIGVGIDWFNFFTPKSFYIRGNWLILLAFDDTKAGYIRPDYPGSAPTWCEEGEKQALETVRVMSSIGAIVIVFEHWGFEYSCFPNNRQISLAHKFIDAGAATVIGSHPHRIQGVEFYKGKPILYSLGNLIFDQKDELGNIGILAELSLLENRIVEVKLIPVETLTERFQPRLMELNKSLSIIENACKPFEVKLLTIYDYIIVEPLEY